MIEVSKLNIENGNWIIISIENRKVTIILSLNFGIFEKGTDGILQIINTNKEQGIKKKKEKWRLIPVT